MRLGEVEIWRNVAEPTSDGVIRMTMRVGEHADREVGQTALLQRQAGGRRSGFGYPPFARLLDQHACRWEIVSDYGMGTVLLGEADRRGNLVWRT